MQAFNGTVHEVLDSLNQAGQVQMEQTLQHLYSSTINVNDALKDATIIAEHWGGNIIDVQQAIGLWTKQVGDLNAAVLLANKGEEMARASGISTMEVYKDSTAIATQMGIKLSQLPGVYDSIAYAALKVAAPLRAIGSIGGSGNEEGMKELFQGLAASAATLGSIGMNTNGIIATLTTQITATGAAGKNAAHNLSSMFAALQAGGPKRAEWESKLGVDAFKSTDNLLVAVRRHLSELMQAQADGKLGVRPQQYESLQTYEKSLLKIKETYDELNAHGGGTLDLVAFAEMQTYQAQMDKLRTSIQAFTITVGQELLPSATAIVHSLSTGLFPTLVALAPAFVEVAHAAILLGASFLALQVIDRVSASWQAYTANLNLASDAERAAKEAGFQSAEQMESTRQRVIELQAAEERTTAATDLASAAFARLGSAAGLSADGVLKLDAETYRAGAAIDKLTESETAATAETARLGTTAGTTAEVVGGEGALAKYGAATRAIGGFGAAAARQLGPLLAIYAAMVAIQQLQQGTDKANDAGLAIQTGLGKNVFGHMSFAEKLRHGASPTTWFSSAATGLQVASAQATGHGKYISNEYGQQVLDHARKDPTVGQPLQAQLDTYEARLKRGDNVGALDSSREVGKLITEYVQNQTISAPDKKFDALLKQLEADSKAAEALSKSLGTGDGPHVFSHRTGKVHGPKKATEQQVAAEAVNRTKADAMADMSEWRNIANAAATDIKRIKKETDPTTESVNALTAAYAKQEGALRMEQSAAEGEIKHLRDRKTALEELVKKHGASIDKHGNMTKGDGSSAVYAEEKAWRMANEAITKATGAIELYQAKRKLLKQTADNDISHTGAEVAISKAFSGQIKGTGRQGRGNYFGVDLKFPTVPEATLNSFKGLKQHLHEVSQSTATVVGAWTKMQIALDKRSDLEDIGKKLALIYSQHPDPALLALLREYRTEFEKLGKTATESADKVQTLNDSLSNLMESISGKNLTDIGTILGLDKGQVEYQKTLIDGYKQIGTYLKQIDTLTTQYGGDYADLPPAAKQMVDYLNQEVGVQEQLIPLLAEQKRIQDSIQYKAADSVIQKFGEQGLTTAVDKLIGSAKTGLQAMIHDWLQQVVTAWWSQTAKKLTDSLFGDPAAKAQKELRAMYTANAAALNAIAVMNRDQVVGTFGNWVNKWNDGVNKLVASTSKGNPAVAVGAGLGVTGVNSNKTNELLRQNNDALTGKDPLAQQSQATATQTGVSNAVGPDTKRGADASEQAAKAAATYLPEVVALLAAAKSGSGSSGGMGGTSLFGTLLGSLLKSDKSASKYLSGKGSWIGSAMDGIGQGQMWGQQMGGGSHTTWGSVGGGIGGAFFGPVGAQVGSFVGSLFGHADNPASMPDKYDTTRFTQFVGELQGSASTAYGPGYNASTDQMQQSLGGKPMLKYIQDWVAAHLNSSNKNEKALAQQYLSQYGTTGNGKLSFNKDLGQEQVVGGSLSGSYVDLHNAADQAIQSIQKLGAAAGAAANPIIAISAYGAPSGYQVNPYNVPGLTSSEYKTIVKNGMTAMPTTSQSMQTPLAPGTSAYATPGYRQVGDQRLPVHAPILPTSRPLVIQTSVNLDGHVVAQTVNAVNAEHAGRYGKLAA
jgi:hypothetical protein